MPTNPHRSNVLISAEVESIVMNTQYINCIEICESSQVHKHKTKIYQHYIDLCFIKTTALNLAAAFLSIPLLFAVALI